MTSNQSSDQGQKINLNMNEIKPTHIANTRREYTRNLLCKKFAEEMKDKLAPVPMDNEKHLQGTKIIQDASNFKNGLNEEASRDYSFWNKHAHPIRQYRRSYDFTKPDSEYIGTSQWR